MMEKFTSNSPSYTFFIDKFHEIPIYQRSEIFDTLKYRFQIIFEHLSIERKFLFKLY